MSTTVILWLDVEHCLVINRNIKKFQIFLHLNRFIKIETTLRESQD